ncbi:hypothetical protein N7468_004061 [Penicillium chermesinum]|uniref:GPI anchored cell wall protein n=1 Tax=Penicillium chermesinum TaxID=63820 RepID=A0A9W9PAL3_9EURO|nr:uncharacterized protein N7468_004061 [Penicillium chermesinum]KAJ5239442.1 hypothetical protein N7468_004061 [Penicillium chermesinum]KAJ6141297.1 hypothetical protein N7470_010193 [Penicillium chermesinum]
MTRLSSFLMVAFGLLSSASATAVNLARENFDAKCNARRLQLSEALNSQMSDCSQRNMAFTFDYTAACGPILLTPTTSKPAPSTATSSNTSTTNSSAISQNTSAASSTATSDVTSGTSSCASIPSLTSNAAAIHGSKLEAIIGLAVGSMILC